MSKCEQDREYLQLALYLLKKRFHTPHDLLLFWGFVGPCLEEHPAVEDCN